MVSLLKRSKEIRVMILAVCVLVVLVGVAVYVSKIPMSQQQGSQTTVRIKMTTFNWGFNVTYIPDFQLGKVYPSPTITVHQGQQVVIELRTLDITHGFAIDELNVKAYVPPGETVTISFTADRVGNFTYYCPVFCGVGHPYMHGIFQVLP
jgi:heme/copper-type cytochrome/quinol oxidase subunit 2